ncbi:putative endoglucanase type K [Venturia inaequalis]|nr:putative endoglucanase type K [Venturia inaequalis]
MCGEKIAIPQAIGRGLGIALGYSLALTILALASPLIAIPLAEPGIPLFAPVIFTGSSDEESHASNAPVSSLIKKRGGGVAIAAFTAISTGKYSHIPNTIASPLTEKRRSGGGATAATAGGGHGCHQQWRT